MPALILVQPNDRLASHLAQHHFNFCTMILPTV